MKSNNLYSDEVWKDGVYIVTILSSGEIGSVSILDPDVCDIDLTLRQLRRGGKKVKKMTHEQFLKFQDDLSKERMQNKMRMEEVFGEQRQIHN